MTSRRHFIQFIPVASAAMLCANVACAADVDPKDPQASALGYAADTAAVDKAKYPKHEATQQCANCALYQGKAGDKSGACPLFAGKTVAAKGWCSAWAKKA